MNNNINRNPRFRQNKSTNSGNADVDITKSNQVIPDDQVEDIIRSFNSKELIRKPTSYRSSDDSKQPSITASRPPERHFNPNDARVPQRRFNAVHRTPTTADVPDTDSDTDTDSTADKGSITFKIAALGMFLLLFTWLLPSANVMNLAPASLSLKDRDTFFMSTSGDLLSNVLSDIHRIPRKFVLELSDVQTPAPDKTKFTKTDDEVRQNFDGKPIDYYKDSTIEVKCWREKSKKTVINYSEIWIAHPSQLRRTLVDNVISKKHLDYPLNIFRRTNGVVGMTSDYCAFRNYGIIVQYGNVIRTKSRKMLDDAIYDKNGIFSSCEDTSDFFESDVFKNGEVIHTFAFGPVLVDDYKVNNSPKLRDYICQATDPYPRAAICQFDNDLHYLLCTVDRPGLTLTEFAQVLQSKGVRFAYNLDGGQTATLMFNKEVINVVAYGGQRPVSDILYFATAVPDEIN